MTNSWTEHLTLQFPSYCYKDDVFSSYASYYPILGTLEKKETEHLYLALSTSDLSPRY